PQTRRLLSDALRGGRADATAHRGRRRGVGRAFRGDRAGELRERAEVARGRAAERFGIAPASRRLEGRRDGGTTPASAASLAANVGARLPLAGRLLCHV